ncbi:MAG: energy transducer TonB [Hyphomonas sp.]
MSKLQRTVWCVVGCLLAMFGGAAAQPGAGKCDQFEQEVSASSDVEAIWSEVTSSFNAGCYEESLALASALRALEAGAPQERTFAYLLLNQLRLANRAAARRVIKEAELALGPYVLEGDCNPLENCWRSQQPVPSVDSHVLVVPVVPISPRPFWSAFSQVPEEGSCDVQFNVDLDGIVEILGTTCTHPAFNKVAQEAILRKKFPPKFVNGQSVQRRYLAYPLKFKVDMDVSND